MSRIMELADAYAKWSATSFSAEAASEARAALVAEVKKLERDAARYRWLRERYTAVNFDWEESGQQAVIFTADNFPIATASCDNTIDAAMEATNEQGN